MPEDPNLDNETDDETETPPAPPAPNPEPAAPPAPPAPVDYEEKFKQSAREAQVLAEQLKTERERNKPLTTDPTEQELREMYPEWDTFLPSEKTFARKNLTLERTAQANSREIAEIRAEKAWEKDLRTAVKAYPQLADRQAEFEQFVFKPTHKGVSVDALAKAFLYDATKDVTPAAPAPRPSGGTERGGTGRQDPPKPKLLNADELKTLRETDSRAYKEYVTSHPNALDVE